MKNKIPTVPPKVFLSEAVTYDDLKAALQAGTLMLPAASHETVSLKVPTAVAHKLAALSDDQITAWVTSALQPDPMPKFAAAMLGKGAFQKLKDQHNDVPLSVVENPLVPDGLVYLTGDSAINFPADAFKLDMSAPLKFKPVLEVDPKYTITPPSSAPKIQHVPLQGPNGAVDPAKVAQFLSEPLPCHIHPLIAGEVAQYASQDPLTLGVSSTFEHDTGLTITIKTPTHTKVIHPDGHVSIKTEQWPGLTKTEHADGTVELYPAKLPNVDKGSTYVFTHLGQKVEPLTPPDESKPPPTTLEAFAADFLHRLFIDNRVRRFVRVEKPQYVSYVLHPGAMALHKMHEKHGLQPLPSSVTLDWLIHGVYSGHWLEIIEDGT